MTNRLRTKLAAAMAAPVAIVFVIALAEAVAAAGHHGGGSKLPLAGWALLAVASLVFGALAVLRVSHAVTAPLVRLATFADDLATHRLSEAVDVILAGGAPSDEQLPAPPSADGSDEIGALATALVAVQDRALSLAVEQAALRHDMAEALTNLGRRNQNLISRQLDYITGIEKGEVDPDKLDQLFKLDHLATRMRRNAESLLVLGGAESPRQWSAPVAVVDVVRSALAEVEDFRRVTMGAIAPVTVAGRVTSDLAHLFAELIENGLSYSPPHTEVRVDGTVRDGRYVVTVSDRGIGMDAESLAQANGRLSGDEAFAGSPSRYLGLYVAGQLAARHGVSIALAPAAGSGTVATVELPPAIVPALAAGGDRATPDPVALNSRIRPGTPEPTTQPAALPTRPPRSGRPHPAPAATRVAATAPPAPAPVAPVPQAPAPATAVRPTPPVAVPAPVAVPDARPAVPDVRPAVPDARPAAAASVAAPPAATQQPVPPAVPAPGAPVAPAVTPVPGRNAPAARRNDLLSLLEDDQEASRPRTRRTRSRGAHAASTSAPPAAAPRTVSASPEVARPARQPSVAAAFEQQTAVAPPVEAPPAEPVAAAEDDPFEAWLDSRLEQLAKLSVEQAVTSAPPTPVDLPAVEGDTGPVEGPAGLPRRRPGAGGEAGLAGLRRREAKPEAKPEGAPAAAATATPAAPEAPRVSSSLFRYLSAVDQRTDDPTQEGTPR